MGQDDGAPPKPTYPNPAVTRPTPVSDDRLLRAGVVALALLALWLIWKSTRRSPDDIPGSTDSKTDP